MNKLQLPQAKLMYAIGQAYRRRKIDESEKRILKEKVITDDIEIFQLLEYTEDENTLIDKLAYLVKSNDQESSNLAVTADIVIPVEQEEASSPWGEFLIKRKMKTQKEHKNEAKQIRNIIHPEKAQ